MFPAVVRFSNGESFNKPDKKAQPRGVAIKLVGVPGPKLLEDQKEAVTQDFLATSHSVTSTVRHVRQFIAFMESSIEAEHAGLPLQLSFNFSTLRSGQQAGHVRGGPYCPSSGDLRQIAGSRRGGSGSSVIEIMRHAVDAASDGLRLSGA